MRLFPRARRFATPLASLVGIAVLTGALWVPSAMADEQRELERQQRSVRGDISDKSADLQRSQAEVSAAGQALLDAEAQLGVAQTHLGDVQARLAGAREAEAGLAVELERTRTELAAASQQLADGQAATVAQRAAVAQTISSIYQQGDPRLMAFSAILDAQTPADVTRQLGFSDVVVGREDRAYDDLRAAEAQLGASQAAVAAAEAEVSAQHDRAEQHVAEVAALESEARGAEADVAVLVTSREQARVTAEAAQAADQAALEELRAQDAELKQQILAAKKAAEEAARAAAAAALAAGRAAVPATNGLTGGRLLAPVDGRITSPFGYRVHPIYGYWGLHDGTDFGAPCGQPLRAAGNGTVLSTVYSSSYGNRLFLDLGIVDGKALTVVYNHLSGYAAKAGDVVSRGATLGYVGSTGWSTGCHLHFTVLVDGDPVDAMPYLT